MSSISWEIKRKQMFSGKIPQSQHTGLHSEQANVKMTGMEMRGEHCPRYTDTLIVF